MTHDDCTFRILCRYSLEIASVFRYSTAGRFFLHEASERGVLALESPGNERREPAGLFLQVADEIEVVHPLLDGLAAAEHHRRGGTHPELMGSPMNVHPFVCSALQPADPMAHGIIEDLGAAAGDRVEARSRAAGRSCPAGRGR